MKYELTIKASWMNYPIQRCPIGVVDANNIKNAYQKGYRIFKKFKKHVYPLMELHGIEIKELNK